MELQKYFSLEELVNQATKVEDQLKRRSTFQSHITRILQIKITRKRKSHTKDPLHISHGKIRRKRKGHIKGKYSNTSHSSSSFL